MKLAHFGALLLVAIVFHAPSYGYTTWGSPTSSFLRLPLEEGGSRVSTGSFIESKPQSYELLDEIGGRSITFHSMTVSIGWTVVFSVAPERIGQGMFSAWAAELPPFCQCRGASAAAYTSFSMNEILPDDTRGKFGSFDFMQYEESSRPGPGVIFNPINGQVNLKWRMDVGAITEGIPGLFGASIDYLITDVSNVGVSIDGVFRNLSPNDLPSYGLGLYLFEDNSPLLSAMSASVGGQLVTSQGGDYSLIFRRNNVPEPASCLMMVLGLALAGRIRRSGKR